MNVPELRIRRSVPGDREALVRLAQLDSADPPAGEYLLAEEDGALRAALPLTGGGPLADPFHPTADLVAALEIRARVFRAVAPAAAPGHGVGVRTPRRPTAAAGRRLRPA